MNTEIKSADKFYNYFKEELLVKCDRILRDKGLSSVASSDCISMAMDDLKKLFDEYHVQFKQPDISEDADSNVSIVRRLEDIMSQFGEAHNMLAKTSLSKEQYQPISSLLATAKVGLFNIYNELKNEITWVQKVKSKQPIPTVDKETEFELLLMVKNELLAADKLPFAERHEATIKILELISIKRK